MNDLEEAWALSWAHTTASYQDLDYVGNDGLAHYVSPWTRFEDLLFDDTHWICMIQAHMIHGKLKAISEQYQTIELEIEVLHGEFTHVKLEGHIGLFFPASRELQAKIQDFVKRETAFITQRDYEDAEEEKRT